MGFSMYTTAGFLECLSQWVAAVVAGRQGDAMRQADMLAEFGDLIAIHPDFIKCFSATMPAGKPMDAMREMAELFRCITMWISPQLSAESELWANLNRSIGSIPCAADDGGQSG